MSTQQTTPAPGPGDMRIAASALKKHASALREFWRGRDGETADIERAEADASERVAAWLVNCADRAERHG